MAAPTLDDFRARFAQFAAVDDATVNVFLGDVVNTWMDETLWAERDFPLAALYLTAHLIQLFLQQTGSGSAFGSGTLAADLFVHSIRIEGRMTTFAQRQNSGKVESSGAAGEELLTTTIYGQLFLQLRGRNIIPVATI